MSTAQERADSVGRVLGLAMTCSMGEHQTMPVAEVVSNNIGVQLDDELMQLAASLSEVLARAAESDSALDNEMCRSLLAAMCIRDTFLVCAAQMESSSQLVGAMSGEAICAAAERVAVYLMGRMSYESTGRVWAWVLAQPGQEQPASAAA